MCSGIDPVINTAQIVAGIKNAGSSSAAFYFAPEMSLMIDRDRRRARENIFLEVETPALVQICGAAADAGIWAHLGSIPVIADGGDGRFANRSIIIDDKGQIRARYDKMHLFDVDLSTGESWRESSGYVAGKSAVLVDTPIGSLGLSVCYDLRFPDLFSALARSGVHALAVPSAFTVPTGSAHWHSLLRARAIESQAFVIAAAQSGQHEDGRVTYGHSLVVDPWGEVLLDMGQGEGLGFVKLDLSRMAEVRAQIPVHANRRDIPSEIKRY